MKKELIMEQCGYAMDVSIVDEWASGGDRFRLVNLGAGPDELQLLRDGMWVPESPQYVHGVLCARICQLRTINHAKRNG